MSKKTYKAVCEEKNQNVNQGIVRFVIGEAKIPAANPGEAPQRGAKAIITFQFTDPKEVAGFEVGKETTITVD